MCQSKLPLLLLLMVVNANVFAADPTSDFSVKRSQCDVPADRARARELLWKEFVEIPGYNRNTSIQVRLSDVRNTYDSRIEHFTDALAPTDASRLRVVFRTLNYGRNEATRPVRSHVIVNWALPECPGISDPADLPNDMANTDEIQIAEGTRKEKEAAIRAIVDAENTRRDDYVRTHPEEFVDKSRVELPIAVGRARSNGSECWIVTCLWEGCFSPVESARLGHVIVYCVSADGTRLLSWVSCD